MKKLLLVLPIIAFLVAGCNSSPQQAVVIPSNVPVPPVNTATSTAQDAQPSPKPATAPVVNAYPDIIVNSQDQLNIPGKYTCGPYSVTIPDFQNPQTKNLTLQPSGKVLLDVMNEAGFRYDVTFSKDCKYVYFVNSQEKVTPIHIFEISSGNSTSINIRNSDFPTGLVMELGDNNKYYPALEGVYVIDQNHLLLTFQNPTTGLDAFTNQTSQAIYDLSANKLSFIAKGGGSPPVLLNFKTNTLIIAGDIDNSGRILNRIEINLETGQKTVITLKTPDPVSLSCDPGAYDNQNDFMTCRNQWLSKFLR